MYLHLFSAAEHVSRGRSSINALIIIIIIIIIVYNESYLEPWSNLPACSRLCTLQPEDCLLVGCLTSLQHASVSKGQICTDNLTCCHTEIEVADHTFYLTQSQYTDTGPTSSCAEPIIPGVWQGSHWSVSFEVTGTI